MLKRQDGADFGLWFGGLMVVLISLTLSGCRTEPVIVAPAFDKTPVRSTPSSVMTKTPFNTSSTQAYLPDRTESPACSSAAGTLIDEQIFSAILQSDLSIKIYLPPCYDPDQAASLPVIYLLHGLGSNHQQWPKLGLAETLDRLITEGRISPLIAVMPHEKPIAPPQSSAFGDAIVGDLVPWVDTHLRTLPKAEARVIAGISRGAAWAVHLGFENPGTFARVGAHSLPLFQADGGQLLGWVSQTPADDLPLFFIDIGQDDREWASAQSFADLLDTFNIPHEWYLFQGEHNDTYWRAHLEQYLLWYSQEWQVRSILQ